MIHLRGLYTVSVCASLLVVGCCLVPVPSLDDYPGMAPALQGTWDAISENEVAMVVFLDSTGDPVSASVTSALIGDLPVTLPNEIILDGQPRNSNISGLPVTVTYVAIARASKSNPSQLIAIGESVTLVVEIKVYAGTALTGSSKLADATITYSGRFIETTVADGSVRAILDVSANAQQLAQGLGVDLTDEDITLSGVHLTKR